MPKVTFETDRTSLVIGGAWNTAILQPDWIGKRLLDIAEGDASIGILSTGGLRIELKSDELSFVSLPGKVEIYPHSNELAKLERVEQLALQLLGLLPETPVSAFGINFGFVSEPEHPLLREVAKLADDKRLLRNVGATPQETIIQRTLKMDNSVLNLILAWTAGEFVRGDLNHHFLINGAATDAKNVLTGAIGKSYDLSKKILSEVYGESK